MFDRVLSAAVRYPMRLIVSGIVAEQELIDHREHGFCPWNANLAARRDPS
jgi:hypothetical protein